MENINSINQEEYINIIITPEVDMVLKEFLETYKRYPVIAITGPAGVGKSTITKLIANYLGAKIYTEVPADNPFLKILKQTSARVNDSMLWINNQNYFLATDVAQITKAFIESKEKPIVFDFGLVQSFVFSDIKLKGNYLKAFNNMYKEQSNTLPKPDIVIEIKANSSTIVSRLEKRKGIHVDDFFAKLTEKVNSYYESGIVNEHYEGQGTKVLTFDNNEYEPENNNILARVLKLLDEAA